MIKKLVCIGMVLIIYAFLFCSCNEYPQRDFELSDPKEYCSATIDEEFEEDRVCVMLKKHPVIPNSN